MGDNKILLICIDGDATYNASKARNVGKHVDFGVMIKAILSQRVFQPYVRSNSIHVAYLTSDVTYSDNIRGSEERRMKHQSFLDSLDHQYKGIEIVKFPIVIHDGAGAVKNEKVGAAMSAKLVRYCFELGDVGRMVLVSGAGGLQFAAREIRSMMPIHVAFFKGSISDFLFREATGHIFFEPVEKYGFSSTGRSWES